VRPSRAASSSTPISAMVIRLFVSMEEEAVGFRFTAQYHP